MKSHILPYHGNPLFRHFIFKEYKLYLVLKTNALFCHFKYFNKCFKKYLLKLKKFIWQNSASNLGFEKN